MLGLGIDALPRIKIYVYDDADQKKLAFGGHNTDIADVFGSSIHITRSRQPHPTLRHELVHALLAHKAPLGLGFRLNMAITEGVAVALEASPKERSVHELAAALIIGKKVTTSLSDLFSPLFWRKSPGHAYGLSGSFFKFLLDQYGGTKLVELYSGGSFSKVYGAPLKDLEAQWLSLLQQVYQGTSSKQYFDTILSQRSQLDRRCPHSREINNMSRDEGFWIRLRQPLGWSPDADYYPWVLSNFKLGDDDTVSNVDYAFLKSRIRNEMKQKQYAQVSLKKWLVDTAALMRKPYESRLQVKLRVLYSDLLSLDDRWQASESVLEQLLVDLKQKKLGDDLMRAVEARLRLASMSSVELNKQWRRYLAGWRKTPPGYQGDGDVPWLIEYLYLRANRSKISTGKTLVEMVDTTPEARTVLPLHKSFYFEYFRKLAEKALYIRQDYDLAVQASTKAKRYATPSQLDYTAMLLRSARLKQRL